MNKSIALLTDFSVDSLMMLRYALKREDNAKLNIFLIHGYRSSDGILDLLFHSKEDQIKSLTNEAFTKALQIIKNGYASRIAFIKVELLSGITSAAIRNSLEAWSISEVYIPRNNSLKLTSERSFDLVPMLKRSGLKITEADMPQAEDVRLKSSLAELFLFE